MAKEDAVEMFYNCCSPEDIATAFTYRRSKQALAPLAVPLTVTPERYGRIPRHYVECLQDKAVPLSTQRSMMAAQPCASVCTLDADHSPFLCRPQELSDFLMGLAA
jgi:hypothetical protein